MNKLSLFFVPVLLFSNPFKSTLEDEVSWLKEESFVMSASREEENLRDTVSSVTIIESEQIEDMGAKNLWEVLRTVPGIDVTQSRMSHKKIESRGIKTLFSEKVLFLLDGHPLDGNLVNGGTTFAFHNFPIDNIKKIEIVRGPASALYGANAFVAIISIETKKPKVDTIITKIRKGSFNTNEINSLFSKKISDFKLSGNIFYGETDGSPAYVKNDSHPIPQSGFTNPWQKTKDIDLNLNNNKLFIKAKYHQDKAGPFFGLSNVLNNEDNTEYNYYFLDVKYIHDFNKKVKLTSKVYYDLYHFNNLWESYPENSTLTLKDSNGNNVTYTYPDGYVAKSGVKNSKLGLENILRYKPNESHTLITGLTVERQKQFDVKYMANYNPLTQKPNNPSGMVDYSDPNNTWAPKVRRDFYAIFIEDLWRVNNKLKISTGIRYDNYSDFGGVTNPKLGINYKLSKNHILKATYGKAFRAPTFAEVHNRNNPGVVGSADLEPEEIETYEVGINSLLLDKKLNTELTLFHSSIKNLIEEDQVIHVSKDNVKTKGLELALKYELKRGSYFLANYSYVDVSENNKKDYISDISAHKANFLLNHRLSKNYNLFLESIVRSKTKSVEGLKGASGYAIFNSTLRIKNFLGNKKLYFKTRVNNILDKKYYHHRDKGFKADNYEQAKRSFFIELTYKF